MIDTHPTTDQSDFAEIRRALGITQAEMAATMGMPARTYQALETGQNPVKPWHLKAAKYAAMEYVAAPGRRASSLPRNIRELVAGVALMLDQEKLR